MAVGDKIYVATKSQLDNLAGTGRKTETVKGVSDALAAHQADGTAHITDQERTTWNDKQDALATEQKRNIYISSTAPVNPQDGDIWIEV
jgi:precorrin-4 methylase